MANQEAQKGLDKKLLMHVAITFVIMFGFQLIPAPAPITKYGMATIGIFIGLIYGWTVSPSNMVWSGLMGLTALATTDFGNASAVLIKAFGSDMVVLNIVGMLMIGALAEAGVSEWLIVKLVTAKFAKGKPWLLTFLLVFGPFILGLLINPMILVIFLMSLYGTLFKKAGYEKGDKYMTMVTLGMVLSILFAPVIFPFKGAMLMFLPVISASTGVVFEYGRFMLSIIPFAVLTMILYIPLMKILGCKPDKMVNADISELEKKYEYGLTKYQQLVLFCLVLYVVGAIVVSFIGGDSGIRLLIRKLGVYGWSMIMCAAMMFVRLDGQYLADPNIVGKHVSWNIIFVITSATTVSAAMTSEGTGVSAFITNLIGPFVSGLSPVIFLAAVGIITFLFTNFFNNLATIYTMIAVVCALYNQGMAFDVQIAGTLIAVIGLIGYLLPASSLYGALLHAQEFMLPSAIYKYGIITMVFIILTLCLIYLPIALFVA